MSKQLSHKLVEFYFGPATIISTHFESTQNCGCNSKDNSSFEFAITRNGCEIFKEKFSPTLNNSTGNTKHSIDSRHSFSVNSDSKRVLISFFKDDNKHAEVGVRFDTQRLSLVQDVHGNTPPTPPVPSEEVITFSYVGADQYYTVPSGVREVIVECWGAGGATQGASAASATYVYYTSGGGGGGGYTKASLKNVAGTNLNVIVGGGGKSGSSGKLASSTYGGGGSQAGGDPNWGTASGGGRSAVQISSVDVVTAGGGGGAGVVQNSNTYPGYCAGGAGGSKTIGPIRLGKFGDGGDAENNTLNSQHGGTGGTQSTGGSNGVTEYVNTTIPNTPVNASRYTGGGSSVYGAGGGGGWYGGGYGGIVKNASGGTTLPGDSSNLVLWLDASDSSTIVTSGPLTSGAIVTQWNDKSKSKAVLTEFINNYTGTNKTTYNPTGFNGLPTMVMPSTSMITPIQTGTFSTGFTFFCVFSSQGNQAYNTLVNRSDPTITSDAAPWEVHNNYVYIGKSSSGTTSGNTNGLFTLATVVDPSIAVLQASPSSPVNYYLNNDLYTNNELLSYYEDTGTNIYIGSRGDMLTSFNGMMSEIMIFDAVLTLEQIQNVQQYLSSKWSVDLSQPGESEGVGVGSSWLTGGGGGGSSYVDVTKATALAMEQASGSFVAENSSLPTNVQGTIGSGALATNLLAVGANGQNGYVKLTLKR